MTRCTHKSEFVSQGPDMQSLRASKVNLSVCLSKTEDSPAWRHQTQPKFLRPVRTLVSKGHVGTAMSTRHTQHPCSRVHIAPRAVSAAAGLSLIHLQIQQTATSCTAPTSCLLQSVHHSSSTMMLTCFSSRSTVSWAHQCYSSQHGSPGNQQTLAAQ